MLVIARRYGQLGNRLFLYAHLIAAARHYGVQLINPCFAEYADLFPATRNDWLCRYDAHLKERSSVRNESPRPLSGAFRRALMHGVEAFTKSMHLCSMRHRPCELLRLGSGETCDLLGDRFRRAVESERPVLLQGWLFRSGELLHQHQTAIRQFFEISASDRSAVAGTLAEARRESDLVVGVHIRRGDYAKFQGGRYYFSDSRYARWMHEIREQLPQRRVRFLVCSHETLDAANFHGLEITSGPGSALQDMYALAEADVVVGPPSTFTAWAAFIGRKPRIEFHSADQPATLPEWVRASSPAATAAA